MPLSKEQLRGLRPNRQPVEISVPGWPDSVLLRYPTFAEWHEVVALNSQAEGSPPAESVAKTVGVCLGNADGSRMLSDSEALELLRQDFEAVMYLYKECWQKVLRADTAVEQAEKN